MVKYGLDTNKMEEHLFQGLPGPQCPQVAEHHCEMDRQHLLFYTEPLASSGSSRALWPWLCPTPHPLPSSHNIQVSKGAYLFLSTQVKDAYQSTKPPPQIVRL